MDDIVKIIPSNSVHRILESTTLCGVIFCRMTFVFLPKILEGSCHLNISLVLYTSISLDGRQCNEFIFKSRYIGHQNT